MKNQRGFLLLLLLSFLVYSCGQRIAESENEVIGVRNIMYSDVAVDTVMLDTISTSFLGFSGVFGDELYFVDKMFCTYFAFNADGTKKYQAIRQGEGPGEVPTGSIDAATRFSDSTIMFFDSSLFQHFFTNLTEYSSVWMQYPYPSMVDYVKAANEYDKPVNYKTDYDCLKVLEHDGKLYYNVFSEHMLFNPVFFPKKYFKNAFTIMMVDRKSGEMEKVMCQYPQFYRDHPKKYKAFYSIDYDIDSTGDFYVQFQADSLVHYYSDNFTNQSCFGFQGRDMNVDYPKIGSSISGFMEFRDGEYYKYGYYNSVKYIEPVGVVVRTYKKGGDATTDGLQIYKDNDLVADIDVPLGFKIGGYIAPYFYSQVVGDEEAETLTVYRFKL